MSAASEPSTGSKQPIFLLSTERSGSNLVRSILNTHPDISAPHPLETAYPWRKVTPPHELGTKRAYNLFRDVLINKNYSFHPLELPLDIDEVFKNYLHLQQHHSLFSVQKPLYDKYAAEEDNSAWVSKYPDLWHCIDDIFEYYDSPRFVYLVRDPRDVVLSFKNSNVGQYHPYFNAKRWKEEQEVGIELLENHPGAVYNLRYKDLLQDPEAIVTRMCEALSIEYDQRMLYYYETEEAKAASESATALENLTSPIMSDNYDKFQEQLPEEEIMLTEKIVDEQLEYFGYDLVHDRTELDSLELDVETYRSRDEKLTREATIDDWQSNPREQIRRQTTRSFAGYMILRYGVFA